MAALMLESLAALPFYAQCLRVLLARLLRALDALVSAQAARTVPEWRNRKTRKERKANNSPASNCTDLNRSESAVCNFSR